MALNIDDSKTMQFPTVEEILKENPNAFEDMAKHFETFMTNIIDYEQNFILEYIDQHGIEGVLSQLNVWLSDDEKTNHYGEHVCYQDSPEQEELFMYYLLDLEYDSDTHRGIKIGDFYYTIDDFYGMGNYHYLISKSSQNNLCLDIDSDFLGKVIKKYG